MQTVQRLGRLLAGTGVAGALLLTGGCVTRMEMAPRQPSPRNAPAPPERDSSSSRLRQDQSGSDRSSSSTGAQPQSEQTRRIEQRILEGINQRRREAGLQPLEPVPQLSQMARRYSRQMARESFYGHVSPQGQDLQDRFRQAGLGYSYIGENLYKSWRIDNPAETAVQGWMKSPGHRQNILRPQFTQTGIGVWREGETVYATQVFRRP
ncbi:MAG: CAP domain-containing protein [Armatimonadota bacterium]